MNRWQLFNHTPRISQLRPASTFLTKPKQNCLPMNNCERHTNEDKHCGLCYAKKWDLGHFLLCCPTYTNFFEDNYCMPFNSVAVPGPLLCTTFFYWALCFYLVVENEAQSTLSMVQSSILQWGTRSENKLNVHFSSAVYFSQLADARTLGFL